MSRALLRRLAALEPARRGPAGCPACAGPTVYSPHWGSWPPPTHCETCGRAIRPVPFTIRLDRPCGALLDDAEEA